MIGQVPALVLDHQSQAQTLGSVPGLGIQIIKEKCLSSSMTMATIQTTSSQLQLKHRKKIAQVAINFWHIGEDRSSFSHMTCMSVSQLRGIQR